MKFIATISAVLMLTSAIKIEQKASADLTAQASLIPYTTYRQFREIGRWIELELNYGDRTLTKAEAEAGMNDFCSHTDTNCPRNTRVTMERLFDEIDHDGNDKIDMEEM